MESLCVLLKDYGSPGPFWEQELESLHHVIEMKNERIHELEKQLLLLEMLVSAGQAAGCHFLDISSSGLSHTPPLTPQPTPDSLSLLFLPGVWSGSDSGSLSPDSCLFLGPRVAVTRAALGPQQPLLLRRGGSCHTAGRG